MPSICNATRSECPWSSNLSIRLSALLTTLNALAADYGGASALSGVATFERQIPALAQGVHAWWHYL
jgi:hypothetical protein